MARLVLIAVVAVVAVVLANEVVCNQSTETNLITNSGFEDGFISNWYSYNGRIAKGHNSKKSWLCLPHAKPYDVCYVSQRHHVCKGVIYYTQFDYLIEKTEDAGDAFLAGYSVHQKNQHSPNELRRSDQVEFEADIYGRDGEATVGAWNTRSGFFRPHGVLRTGFLVDRRPSGKTGVRVHVDNVIVKRVPDKLSIKSRTQSAIINGGFETGNISPWTVFYEGQAKNAQPKIVTPGINSTYALKLELDSHPILQQNLVTTANTTYLLAFEMNIARRVFESEYDDSYILIKGQNNETMGANTYRFRPKNLHYNTFSFPIFVDRNNISINIQLNTGGVATIDNFQMLKVENSFLEATYEN